MVLETPEKKEYPVLPANVYQVEIVSADKVMKVPYGAQPGALEEPFIAFRFGILTDGDYRGRMLFKDTRPVKPFPPFNGGKSSLIYEIGTAVRGGQAYTKEEAEVFTPADINAWIGQQLRLVVIQKPKKDGTMGNSITGYLPVEKTLDPLSDDKQPSSESLPV